MRNLILVPALSLFGIAGASRLVEPGPTPAPAAAAGTFEIDAGHSSVVFAVEHLGVSYVYGRFNKFSGTFVQDEDPAKSSVRVEIDAASIDTASEGRDKHLRSPDFFNAEQFPRVSFQSTKVARKPGGLSVEGQLELRGTKKPVTIELEQVGEGERGQRGFRSGYRGNFRFKRSDFGMTYMVEGGGLGDQIEVTVSIQGVRK